MGLAVGLLIIMLLMALGVLAFIIAGIVFVIVGIRQKKKGGKGTIGKVGIGFLMVPLLILLFVGGSYIWRKAAIKCVADEWRYTSINAGEGSAVRNMLRSLLVSVDDGDIETFRREFTQDIQDIQDDRHFEDTVDDFLDELYEIIDDRDDDNYLDVL